MTIVRSLCMPDLYNHHILSLDDYIAALIVHLQKLNSYYLTKKRPSKNFKVSLKFL